MPSGSTRSICGRKPDRLLPLAAATSHCPAARAGGPARWQSAALTGMIGVIGGAMNQRILNSMTAERLLIAETERAALAELDEDELLDLHGRIRRARTEYRRGASQRLQRHGGRAGEEGRVVALDGRQAPGQARQPLTDTSSLGPQLRFSGAGTCEDVPTAGRPRSSVTRPTGAPPVRRGARASAGTAQRPVIRSGGGVRPGWASKYAARFARSSPAPSLSEPAKKAVNESPPSARKLSVATR